MLLLDWGREGEGRESEEKERKEGEGERNEQKVGIDGERRGREPRARTGR